MKKIIPLLAVLLMFSGCKELDKLLDDDGHRPPAKHDSNDRHDSKHDNKHDDKQPR